MLGKARSAGIRRICTLLLIVFTWTASGCSREPPEEALRARIAEMQAAAQARDSKGVVEALSDEFSGPGGMDRDGFRRYLAVIWLRNREVGVRLGPLDVELVGDRARVGFTAAATGGEGWLPDRAQVYDVRTAWRLEDGEWMLLSASWEPRLPGQ